MGISGNLRAVVTFECWNIFSVLVRSRNPTRDNFFMISDAQITIHRRLIQPSYSPLPDNSKFRISFCDFEFDPTAL